MSDMEIYHNLNGIGRKIDQNGRSVISMFTVIDTFRVSTKMIQEYSQQYPGFPKKEGLMAVLDPDQARAPFAKPDNVRVSKPDGSEIIVPVDEVQIGARGVVALLFSHFDDADLPRGSKIELLP